MCGAVSHTNSLWHRSPHVEAMRNYFALFAPEFLGSQGDLRSRDSVNGSAELIRSERLRQVFEKPGVRAALQIGGRIVTTEGDSADAPFRT